MIAKFRCPHCDDLHEIEVEIDGGNVSRFVDTVRLQLDGALIAASLSDYKRRKGES